MDPSTFLPFQSPTTLRIYDLNFVPNWQYHIAAIVIFLVWLELMMIVGRFPMFGLYVQMFTKVAVNFAKFLLAYCCLLIAFGLSFGVLFSSYPAFKSFYWTLLKTITMMAGELEFEDIFYNSDVPIQFPVTSHGMFFTFVLLVTIILTNLLVGLAVSDIQGLQASAGLDRLTRQVELVARLESLFFSRIFATRPPALIRMCQRMALLRTSRYHLQFCFRPNDPRDHRLSTELSLNVYKLVAERRDRNISIKRRRREQNMSYFASTLKQQYAEPFLRANHMSSKLGIRIKTSQQQQQQQPRPYSVQPNCKQFITTELITSSLTALEKQINKLQIQFTELLEKMDSLQSAVSLKFADIFNELNASKFNHEANFYVKNEK